MKKILIHSNYSPIDSYGGIEVVVGQLISLLRNCDYTVECFCGSDENSVFQIDSIAYIYRKVLFKIAGAPIFSLGNTRFIHRGVKSDLIIFQEPFPFLWPSIVLLNKIYKKKIIVLVHADPVAPNFIKKIYSGLRNFVFSGCTCVATSPNVGNKIFSNKFKSCKVIPLSLQDLSSSRGNVVSKYTIPGRFVLYVGRLASYKGIDILLAAASIIPHVEIVVAGQGPLANFVAAEVSRLELKNIHFYNEFIDEQEKLTLIDACEFVVFPSTTQNEAFGLVQLEAMRAGKPLINTELDSGVNFVAPHMVSALTVTPSNPTALANAVATLWNSPDLIKHLGENSRKRYLELFTEDHFIQNWKKLIEEVL